MELQSFEWGSFSSTSAGMLVKSKSDTDALNREIAVYEVIGRSGDLTVDLGRSKNFDVTYECRVMDKSLIQGIKSSLTKDVGKYEDLSDSYIGDIGKAYCKAVTLKFLAHGVVDLSITFSCYEESEIVDTNT